MNGFVVVDKEENMTSFFAAGLLRGIFHEKKVGHTGTLDPMAVGVLPVAIGKATRFIDFLPDSGKSYVARFRFGVRTDTLDRTGTVLSQQNVCVDEEEVRQILPHFKGEQKQMPPMYSALMKDGVRLYTLARQGIEVEREARQITVSSLELTGRYDDEFEISVSCSKGTYIRSLISDIGEMQGSGAVMTALQRTASNGFTLEQAHTLAQLRQLTEQAVIPVWQVLANYPAVFVTASQARRFSNGGELDVKRIDLTEENDLFRVFDPESSFLGIGGLSEDRSQLLVKRVYNND